MLENNSTAFLILNASIVWLILAYVLMMLLRSKILFACVLVLPFIAAPSLNNFPQASEWMGWYLQSIVYGAGGILIGVVLAQIGQTKRLITNISKGSFFVQIVARLAIGLSGFYVLVFFAKRIASQLPFIDLALDYILPGTTIEEVFDGVSMAGVFTALSVIAVSLFAIFSSKYIPAFTNKNITVKDPLDE